MWQCMRHSDFLRQYFYSCLVIHSQYLEIERRKSYTKRYVLIFFRVSLIQAIHRIVRAPMSFFDTTPLGRIINRFSKDIDTMDNKTSDSYRMFLMTLTMILSALILAIASFYWFALVLGPLAFGFCFAAMFYRATGMS